MSNPGLKPGDDVLFARGDTWNEQLTLPNGVNGSAASPITISNYGSGALPVIDGGSSLAACFYASSGSHTSALWSYLVISGFECRNTTEYGILFHNYDGTGNGAATMAGLVLENNYIHNTGPGACSGCGTPFDDGNYRNQLMFLDENLGADGVQVLNNTVNHCGGHNCVQVQGDTGAPLVQGNNVANGLHNNIDLKAVVGAVVDSNISHDGGTGSTAAYYNENTAIPNDEVTWTRNVAYNTGQGIECEGGGGSASQTVTCRAYNNTLYVPPNNSAIVTGSDCSQPTSWDVRNNVLDTNNPAYMPSNCGPARPVIWDYNDDCATESSCDIQLNGTDFSSASSMQASGFGLHDLWEANPLYVNASATPPDLHLQAGSPLIGAGLPGLVAGYTDIGAYQDGSASATATATPTVVPTPTSARTATPAPTVAPTAAPTLVPTPTVAPTTVQTPTPTPKAVQTPTPSATASGVPLLAHVFIVAEENHSFSDMIGNRNMPYVNGLASSYGLAINFYSDVHPSIGNYLIATSGQDISNDDSLTPSACGGPCDVQSVFRSLTQAGVSWKVYAENLSAVGDTGTGSYPYAVWHDPGAYYVANDPLVGAQSGNLVPLEDPNVGLAADLANNRLPAFAWITPNLLDDWHDGTDVAADQWLQTNLGPVLSSSNFGNGVLVVWMDEGTDNACSSTVSSGCGGQVPVILAGTPIKNGYQGTGYYQEGAVLRLAYDALGLGTAPGSGATPNSMAEFFK